MFIGHVPAGYIWTRHLCRRPAYRELNPSALLTVGLIASVLPDLDLAYFYLIDGRQTLHHGYWSHIPIFWVALFAVLLLFRRWIGGRRAVHLAFVVVSNALIHLALDTIAGGIAWLYPYSTNRYVLVAVPAVHGWWVWNFVLHWTFALEVGLCLWAVGIFWRRRRPGVVSGAEQAR